MFIGHYAAGFAVKSAERRLPLWVLFLAVQLVDILWAGFVLLGIEKLRIVPGFTASNPLDLYYMPYTHSLLAAFGWAGLSYAVCRNFTGFARTMKVALLLALAVFSHWPLDFIVHVPDLPLVGDSHKVGLGLWNYAIPALLLEGGILFLGILLYLRSSSAVSPLGKYGVVALGLIMLAMQVVLFFGPPPASDRIAAVEALLVYGLFAGVIAWLEKKRVPLDPLTVV